MRAKAAVLPLFPDQVGPRGGGAGPAGKRRAPADQAAVGETPRAQFRPLACRTLLNENPNRKLPFYWTINPYRGCEFGCSYCYARYTHEYLEHRDPDSFERRIYVKFQAAPVLADTLRPELVRGRPIALGTATDPYQPGEKRFEVTRRILDVLASCPGIDLSITTKSPLIARDIDLLRRIARSGRLVVNVSLITLNPDLARIVEGHAPSPRRRLETIRALASAGLDVGVFVMPILPWITDGEGEMRALLRGTRAAGARFACAQPVRLLGIAWTAFRPVLRSHFPHLLAAYAGMRRSDGTFPDRVTGATMDVFRRLRDEVGLRSGARSRERAFTRSRWKRLPVHWRWKAGPDLLGD